MHSFLIFALVPLILSMGIISVLQVELIPEADALKSKGNSLTETGSNKVCGDRLCSEIDSQDQMKHHDSMKYSGSMDIHAMMERMDKVHENHQQHMMQFWNSMAIDEQSQMYHKMQKMIEKMESMDIQEHMKMMFSMGEKHGEKKSHGTHMYSIHPEKMRTSTPLPETSMGPQIDYSKGYLVEEIKDGLYWVTDGAYQAMFLTTGQGVIVVDAPPSIGENYLKAIAEVTEERITHVIYSHTHNDHVGSMNMFPDDAIYVAHQEAADTLEKRNDPNRPIPTVTFEDKYTLEVGNQKLELAYYGPMHEPGNIFIYASNQKVLMLVDVIFPGWTPFKDLAMAQDVTEFLAAHDKVLEYDFDTFIGGHLTRLGTPEDVQIQKEYFQDIQTSAGKANQEVSFMAIGQEVGFSNPWLVFQIYADTITQQCTDEVVPKWIDRLGGVDLFTYDHCWKISESQRID